MREILFRGKTSGGEWVEGYYSNLGGNHPRVLKENIFIGKIGRVLEFENIDVLPETVGQYIGLTDKNGTKIFEGDIIESCEYDDIYAVKYFDSADYPAFDCVPEIINCDCNGLSYLINVEGCEVIGNIHDNPELLETAAKPIDKNIAQNGLAPATENFELMEG